MQAFLIIILIIIFRFDKFQRYFALTRQLYYGIIVNTICVKFSKFFMI